MEIIWLLGFIALIAVIFGVSMHQAFWGIVAFIFGAIIVAILAFFVKAFSMRRDSKTAHSKIREAKLVQKDKRPDLLGGLVLFMCVFYPIVMTTLMATVFKEFAQNNLAAVLAIVLLPSPILVAFVLRRATKKAHQR